LPFGLGRPPHGSERALLTHSALASGSDVKASLRPGVQDAGAWKPTLRDSPHLHPVDATFLSPAPKRTVPVPDRLDSKCSNRVSVGGDGVVYEVAANDARQPCPLLGRWQVHPLAKRRRTKPSASDVWKGGEGGGTRMVEKIRLDVVGIQHD
jgi:hypothetical protein